MQLPKKYAAEQYEDAIYALWEKSRAFTPKVNQKKKPFVISIPPPNVTGSLHLGHASTMAFEDIMIRYHRMKGDPTLWVPGTDHAGIATQNKVEKLIAQEGLTRQKLGRKKFLERVWKYKEESQDAIRRQIRKMGASCDWTRERFTLDEGLSKAVREVFVRMFEDGLIYRGNRIVNWCPRCQSTLSDDEVAYREEKGKFYYLKYGPFVIGTARPETKFADKVIVVHPKDKRYTKEIGKRLKVPWIEGEVEARIMADESVDPEFGSGAMTITPAHDFIDFEIAQHHPEIEILKIIDERGNLTEAAGEFAGQNAHAARPNIIEKMQHKGLVDRIDENYVHNVSLCYRCDTPIEPLVSEQWFVNVNKEVPGRGKTLKQLASAAVYSKKITIIPDRFNKTYFHWMDNLRDWCISRQIWWGHRVPVWYCECKKPIVSRDTPKQCPVCGSKNLRQDEDTLDTWFSSSLWTFSTLGWPEKTKDLQYFHPTSVLETGYDIIFFWVARMIIMTAYVRPNGHDIPFTHVYLHGLVRDKEGQKMSKSKGNGIDPLEMIEKYGTDSVRLSLILGATPGNDVRLYEEKIAGFRNFVNKIWNAARYALGTVADPKKISAIDPKKLSPADKWVLHETNALIKEVTTHIEQFRFSEAGNRIYDFTWGIFCDWYLEINKAHPNDAVLLYVLKTVLKLLHPYTPFVTEVLWKELGEQELLMTTAWPTIDKKYSYAKEAKAMEVVVNVVQAIRRIRTESNVPATKKIHAVLHGGRWTKTLQAHGEAIRRLANVHPLDIAEKGKHIAKAVTTAIHHVDIFLPVADMMDPAKERERLEKEIKAAQSHIDLLEFRLGNQRFVERAPKDVVEKEREKLSVAVEYLKKLEHKLNIVLS